MPLGAILVQLGELSGADMIKAVAIQGREDARLGEILLAHQMVSEAGLFRGLAMQYGCDLADLNAPGPDVRLIDRLGAPFCLRHAMVPIKRVGAATLIATARPEGFAELLPELPHDFGPVMMVVAPESEIQRAVLRLRQRALAVCAQERVAARESCRGWQSRSMARFVAVILLAILAGILAAPRATFLVFSVWAIVALVLNTALKAAAAVATLRAARRAATGFATRRNDGAQMRLPKISLMVPLFQEREIAQRLVARLNRLNYPRELTDICLVVEEDDL
ncbi:MAG: glycosyl transferase, partial [Paracoccaceae bacterium]